MGLTEDRAEKERKNILALLKKYRFSLESEETEEDGERREIFVKGGERFILGKEMTFALGKWKTTMPYKDADEIFTPDYFSCSDVQDPTPATIPQTCVERYVNRTLERYFNKIKKSAIGCISEISDFFSYKRAA